MQYGGGKGNTLAALWHKVQNETAKTTQHEAAELFSPHSEEWLSAHQISSCLTLLLHTKYRHAVHQAAIGSAHKVCDVRTLEKLLHEASQISFKAERSMLEEWQCSTITGSATADYNQCSHLYRDIIHIFPNS